MKKGIYENLIFKEWFTRQMINDIAATQAFEIAKRDDFLKNFNITFMFLHNEEEFVLPLQGHCDFIAGEEVICLVPITPKIAIYFYNGKKINNAVIQGNAEHCRKINELSFNVQRNKGYGYVISKSKKIMQSLMADIM